MALNDQPVRTRDDLIKGLLERAFNGESRFSPEAMQKEIETRLARAAEMPEGHKAMLKVIRAVEQDNRDFAHSLRQAGVAEKDIPPESRALRNLSIRERLNGKANITYQTTAPTTVRTISLVCDDVRENVYIPRIKLHSCPP